MPQADQFARLAERVVHFVKDEAGCDAIVRDGLGDVVCGSTAAPGERAEPLVACPITVGGRSAGSIAVAGAGVADHLVARLAAMLLAHWCEEMHADGSCAPPAAHGAGRPRVLVAHASPGLLDRVRAVLEADHEVLSARTVSEARSMARDGPEAILCEEAADLCAPLLSDLKFEAELSAIPVVVVSRRARVDGESILNLGADDVLPSDASASELRVRVRAAIRYHRMYPQIHEQRRGLVRANRSLARSEARTRAVVESAQDGIVLLDQKGRIESLNASAERMLACPAAEAGGKVFVDHFAALASRRALAEAFAERVGKVEGAGAAEYEITGRTADGREFPMECRLGRLQTGAGVGLCVFLRDLTERRRLQLELQQAQKLEAVGRLAAGIAHEINTPIQFVGDNTAFLKDAFATLWDLYAWCRAAAPPAALGALEGMEQESDLEYLREQVPMTLENTLRGVQRVATIVRGMKEFAHPDQIDMTATDLNRAVLATLEVSRNEYKYVADVETELGDVPLVVCHAGDVNQAILNLVVNAAHAIADAVKGTAERGRIRISTRALDDRVVVAVADTGIGISSSIRDKIFDPFFTTKEVGRGSGQGLAIARAIAQKHGGAITFETAAGKGTTFYLQLPVNGPTRAREVA